MAKASSTPGRPANFKNLSPFAGKKKSKEKSGQGFLFLGAIAIIAAVAVILRTLSLQG